MMSKSHTDTAFCKYEPQEIWLMLPNYPKSFGAQELYMVITSQCTKAGFIQIAMI